MAVIRFAGLYLDALRYVETHHFGTRTGQSKFAAPLSCARLFQSPLVLRLKLSHPFLPPLPPPPHFISPLCLASSLLTASPRSCAPRQQLLGEPAKAYTQLFPLFISITRSRRSNLKELRYACEEQSRRWRLIRPIIQVKPRANSGRYSFQKPINTGSPS